MVVVVRVSLNRVGVGVLGDIASKFGGDLLISIEDIALSEYFELSIGTSSSVAGIVDIVSPVDSVAPMNAAVLGRLCFLWAQ